MLTFYTLQVVRKCRLEKIIREDNRLLEAPGIIVFLATDLTPPSSKIY